MAEEIIIKSTCLVQSTKLISSSSSDNITSSSNRIDLTPWDLQLLLLDSIQKGLLFHKPTISQEHNLLGKNVIDHLKISLSKTLDLFPPLSGRLGVQKNDDNSKSFYIISNNLGAEFIHAIAQGVSMADILDPTYVPTIVHSFFNLNRVPNHEGISKPLLSVQVTEFIDGVFLGCTMNHSIADGTSFWNFINSWSEISLGSEILSNSPVFKPWFPDNSRIPVHIPPWDELILDQFHPPLLKERIFHLTKKGIAKLKAKANSEVDTKKISSLQAILAHVWRAVARCSNLEDKEEISIGIIVGARPRLQPPLPKGYFGNAVHFVIITTTAGELIKKNGLGWAALKINKKIEMQKDEEVKKWYGNWIKNPEVFKKELLRGNFIGTSSSPRFNMYGNDFGWGKPVAIRSGSGNKFGPKFTLFNGAKDGDMDIEACIFPETLISMGKDAEFMEAFSIDESAVCE